MEFKTKKCSHSSFISFNQNSRNAKQVCSTFQDNNFTNWRLPKGHRHYHGVVGPDSPHNPFYIGFERGRLLVYNIVLKRHTLSDTSVLYIKITEKSFKCVDCVYSSHRLVALSHIKANRRIRYINSHLLFDQKIKVTVHHCS